MSGTPDVAASVCYRHPDRVSYIACQRCGRTICPECQTPGAVGVICPDDMRASRQSAPKTKPVWLTRFTGPGKPVVTYGIIALCVVVFIVQSLPVVGGAVTDALQYAGLYTAPQYGVPVAPWRLVTVIFTHASFLHILLNMLALLVMGSGLEPLLGRARFAALFLIAGLAGSTGVAILAPLDQPVVGASGAVFGLFAAFFIIQRHLGQDGKQVLVLIGINLIFGFIPGTNIAWQAHVGGLVGGALAALIMTRTRARRMLPLQVAGLVVLAVALVALSFWHPLPQLS